jgi:hypothetical protein
LLFSNLFFILQVMAAYFAMSSGLIYDVFEQPLFMGYGLNKDGKRIVGFGTSFFPGKVQGQ